MERVFEFAGVDSKLFQFLKIMSPGVCWGGSRGGSGGSVEPPKMKQTQIFLPYFFLRKRTC